ncbi:DNA cytosine methyltransferase [Sphingomonas sediminicola]|uniref:DNA cytosine methyltransferase n=1 Tax=Sphingomonas sediminicola TaxID=386874 RepID=UPI003CCD6BAA
MAKIIRRLRPRIFLFENVRGLLTSKWTRDGEHRIWDDVLAEFRRIPGYHVRWTLVRAGDYGVPQNRPRVLIVGIRKDVANANPMIDLKGDPKKEDAVKCGFLPKPEPSDCPDLIDLLDDLVDPKMDKYFETGVYPPGRLVTTEYPRPATTPEQEAMRVPAPKHEHRRSGEVTDHEYSKHAPNIVKKFRHMIDNEGEIPEHARTKKFAQRVLPKRWARRPEHHRDVASRRLRALRPAALAHGARVGAVADVPGLVSLRGKADDRRLAPSRQSPRRELRPGGPEIHADRERGAGSPGGARRGTLQAHPRGIIGRQVMAP